jgi:hypothetical protein
MHANALKIDLARLEAQARRMQTEITLAAEEAASRASPKGRLPADPAEWNDATWRRYLAEAKRMNDLIGDPLGEIYRDIGRVKRLTQLPLAA